MLAATVLVKATLFVKSLTTHATRQTIHASVCRRVVIAAYLIVECFCAHSAPVHNTCVYIHMVVIVSAVSETFLALLTIKLESSYMKIEMSDQITFRAEFLVTLLANMFSC